MPFTITCPSCGQQGIVPDDYPATEAQCPGCGTFVEVPANPGAIPVGSSEPADPAYHQFSPEPASDEVNEPSSLATAAESVSGPAEVETPPAESVEPPAPMPEEKPGLQGYLERQFAELRRQREEFVRLRSEIEAALVAREQELHRQARNLAARNEALERREAELAEQEFRVAAAVEKLETMEDRLAEVKELLGRLQLDVDAECFQVQELREHSEMLRQQASDAQGELDRLQAQIQENRQTHEQEQHLWQTRRLEMERRYSALDQAEQAMQRRIAELDQIETQIRSDVERQRQELASVKQSLEERSRADLRPLLEAAGRELAELRAALHRAQGWEEREKRYRQAVHQRNQKIAELEQHLAGNKGQRDPRLEQQYLQVKQQLEQERRQKEAVQRRLAELARELDQLKNKTAPNPKSPPPPGSRPK
jgi:chromosome segregation ATPase